MLGQNALLIDAFNGDIAHGGLPTGNGDSFGIIPIVLGGNTLPEWLDKFGSNQAGGVAARQQTSGPNGCAEPHASMATEHGANCSAQLMKDSRLSVLL